jgi:cytochrome c oxidase cbb3-type subunit 3
MSDFFSSGWGYYVATISLLGIIWCLWLLYSQRKWLKKDVETIEDTGHEWDGIRELNNPVPRWWTTMYALLCVFALGYLALYPGLGEYKGMLGYTTAEELTIDQAKHAELIKPIYAKFEAMSIQAIANDPEAKVIGQRLFLNNCAQCHGSDARGSPSFPNLIEGDPLYGRTPESIEQTITHGRNGIMPPFKGVVDAAQAVDVAQYVRSFSGLAHDQIKAIRGKAQYNNLCAACHGAEGRGNTALGAPSFVDGVWLYGSSENTIVQAIMNGRNNRMPAQNHVLTPEQIKLLTAWVWGLSHNTRSSNMALNDAAVQAK